MLMRAVHILAGTIMATAGGYLAWIMGTLRTPVFPPESGISAWPAILSLLLASVGLSWLGYGLSPRTAERSRKIEEAARRQAALEAADAYYASKTRAANRDWRSGDLPPPAPRQSADDQNSKAEPAPSPPSPMGTAPPLPDIETAPSTSIEAETAAFPQAMHTETSQEPDHAVEAQSPSSGIQTQEPIPSATSGASPLRLIRDAIAAGDLDRAELLLGEERDRLSAAGDAERMALAELTGLAGDHAAAAGRIGSAKWLWRLALQRFAAADAIGASSARDVSERLRLADN